MSADNKAIANNAKAPTQNRNRSIAEIEADIVESRERLVETVSQLHVAVRVAVDPRRLLRRQVERVKGFFVDEYGGVRPERVAVTIGVVVTVVVIRRSGRRRRARS